MSDNLFPALPRSTPVRRLVALSTLAVAAALPAAIARTALAQDQAAQDPTAQAQPADTAFEDLVRLVDNYYHTARMANFTAAEAYGNQIITGNYDPEMLLDAFVEVHRRRSENMADLDELMLKWQSADELSAVATEIAGQVNAGRVARATNRNFIAEQVERLAGGTIAYRNALAQLRNSGEYAVPVMIQYLQDREKAQFHADIRRAMRDLGVDMLSPLWAACQMDHEQVLLSIMSVLGDLQYDASIPYLLEQVETSQSEAVRNAATQALKRLGYTGGSNAAAEFYRLGERFFYEQTPVVPNRRLGTATIWSWGGEQAGLVRTDVPPQIFNEVMAMRAAGKALKLGQGMDDALGLWLASNYRREGELGEGEVDRTQPEGSPSAHFYGAQAGTQYLLKVLERAETDRVRLARGNRYNAADVSLRAIKSLQEIVGRGNISAGETPLTTAMNFPDRRVRIEAAFALAQSLPQQPIAGQEQVVPLLADALSQTGQPSVLVLSNDQELRNRTVEELKLSSYRAAGAASVVDAVSQAQQLPSVDVVVIDSRLGDREIDTLFTNAQANPKVSGAAKLVLVNNQATRYERLKLDDPTIETTTAREGDALKQAIEGARTSVGALPLDPQAATELATRSGQLLQLLGTRNSIFRIESGEEFLLAALSDERPEVRTLAGEVVALLDSGRSQSALLAAALRPEESPEVRISFFNSLAASAKFFGNRLNGDQVSSLLAAAANRENLQVQASAAEAVGAANLPSDQARRLIIEQTAGTERSAPQSETAGAGNGP
jgi:HEAT repeat protein